VDLDLATLAPFVNRFRLGAGRGIVVELGTAAFWLKEKKVRRVCFGLNASTCDSLISLSLLSAYRLILSHYRFTRHRDFFDVFDTPNTR
jgi:hypothetical protein